MLGFFLRLSRYLPGALALAVLALATHAAQAAQLIVYTGTLQGAGQVVMELNAQASSSGVLSGRYFYPNAGVDIPLIGTEQTLAEPPPHWKSEQARAGQKNGAPPVAATWQGTRDAQGYRGTWTDARSGKQRAFDLRRVADYNTKSLPATGVNNGISTYPEINAELAPYDTLKMTGHAEPVGEDVGHGAVAYRMWRDPRTQFLYPRLSRHPDEQVRERVNHLLEQRHWRKSLGALRCMAEAYTDSGDIPNTGTLGNFDDEVITVTWLSRALMTVTESGSLDCGGAHPDNHFEPYTYDLLRGEYLDWNRVFDAYDFADGGRPKAKPALLDITATVQRTLAAAEAEGNTTDPSKDGCSTLWPDYLSLGAQAPGALSLSVSGVGHASGICLGTLALVPFPDLAPYLKPGGQAYLATD